MCSARRWSIAVALVLAALLAGCPRNPDHVAGESAVAQTAGTGSAEVAVAPAAAVEQVHKPAPRKSGPLPPQRLVEPAAVDRTCTVDADCVIKDIGSCCGAFPSCVNRDSPANPDAVKAACEKTGQAAHCSRRVLEQCACRQGQCVAAGKTPVGGWVDDAPSPPDPTR